MYCRRHVDQVLITLYYWATDLYTGLEFQTLFQPQRQGSTHIQTALYVGIYSKSSCLYSKQTLTNASTDSLVIRGNYESTGACVL